MAQKPETIFRQRLRKRLNKIPRSWWESIQQLAISGTPDIIGCIGPYFVALEVKSGDGVSSPLQTLKRERILNAGGVALVVDPSNFESTVSLLEELGKKIVGGKLDKFII